MACLGMDVHRLYGLILHQTYRYARLYPEDPYFFKKFRRELEQGMQVKSKKNNLYF